MNKRTTLMILALALMGMSAQAQTITNVGPGEAGSGGTYKIGMTDDGVYILINGIAYPVLPTMAGTPYAYIKKWDDYKGKFVPYGMIKAKSLDGTQFLSGTISVRAYKAIPRMRVTDFGLVAFKTPAVMPTVQVSSLISVYVYSWVAGGFVPRPDLNIVSYTVTGTKWLNSDYSLHSAVYDTNGGMVPISQLTIIPAPGGLGGVGGATLPGVYPTKNR